HDRHKIDSTIDRPASELGVIQDDRQEQGKRQLDDHGAAHIEEAVLERVPEQRVLEYFAIIAPPDEVRHRADAAPIVEGVDVAHYDRVGGERYEQDKLRQNE